MFTSSRKRKFSSKTPWKGRKRFRLPGYKRNPYGYGPVGGSVLGRSQGTTQAVIRQPLYMPDRMFTKLCSASYGSFGTGAAGANNVVHMRPSSAVSTGGSFTTTSYAGFSQLCSTTAIYRSYIVHAFAYDIEMVLTTNSTSGMGFGVLPQAAFLPAPASVLAIQGAPRAKTMVIQQDAGRYKLRGFHRVGEIYGQSPQTVAIADSFSALYNATPTSEVYLHFAFVDLAGTTQLAASMKVSLYAYIEFFGRNGPA